MITLTVDDRELRRELNRLGSRAADGTKPLRQLDAAVKADMGRSWTNNGRATGGTVRNADWKPFNPQYTRKDGTEVPAWGGVPKVNGRGNVKGKKRPSGKRVTLQSVIGQDTGRYRRALLASRANIIGRNTLIIGGESLPVYADRQNELRPIVRWIPRDQDTYIRIARAYLDEISREASR